MFRYRPEGASESNPKKTGVIGGSLLGSGLWFGVGVSTSLMLAEEPTCLTLGWRLVAHLFDVGDSQTTI